MKEGFTALDTDVMESIADVQPNETETAAPTAVETDETPSTEVQAEPTETETTPETTTPQDEIEIEGLGKVKVADIKEWQKGNLRQADYTKKTQEIAQQKAEVADALEVFNYLKTNPHLVETLKSIDEKGLVNSGVMNKATPENAMMQELWYKQKAMEIDSQVAALKTKYGEIDEIKLFNTAREMGTQDLEFVYKAIAFDGKQVDEKSLIERAKEELRMELKQNRAATTTIVSTQQTAKPTQSVTISAQEARVAEGMGMSAADYAKWRDK